MLNQTFSLDKGKSRNSRNPYHFDAQFGRCYTHLRFFQEANQD
jgi:hypothetical protein